MESSAVIMLLLLCAVVASHAAPAAARSSALDDMKSKLEQLEHSIANFKAEEERALDVKEVDGEGKKETGPDAEKEVVEKTLGGDEEQGAKTGEIQVQKPAAKDGKTQQSDGDLEQLVSMLRRLTKRIKNDDEKVAKTDEISGNKTGEANTTVAAGDEDAQPVDREEEEVDDGKDEVQSVGPSFKVEETRDDAGAEKATAVDTMKQLTATLKRLSQQIDEGRAVDAQQPADEDRVGAQTVLEGLNDGDAAAEKVLEAKDDADKAVDAEEPKDEELEKPSAEKTGTGMTAADRHELIKLLKRVLQTIN